MTTSKFETAKADPSHGAALVRLFEACDSPCFCRFWHFEGTNNDWLARCAEGRGASNREAFLDALAAGSDEARGVVAIEEGEIVGWTKVAPAAATPKLYARRLYRSLPCFAGDREGVFVIGCLLVHPKARRRGAATALVAGAVTCARDWGARSIEAFPRVPTAPVVDEELWTGPLAAFSRNGFEVVNDFAPYPVLRLTFNR